MSEVMEQETQEQETAAKPFKLTDAELDAFSPKCAACGDPVSRDRVKGRKKTCAKPECARMMAQFKRHIQLLTKCPACYRPSTPEERKLYKAWRNSRGEVLSTVMRGRPSKKRERIVEDAAKETLSILQRLQRGALAPQQAGEVAEAVNVLSKIFEPHTQV
jgi:hypothetical protein